MSSNKQPEIPNIAFIYAAYRDCGDIYFYGNLMKNMSSIISD